jgi:protoporphyrinogen oxidase
MKVAVVGAGIAGIGAALTLRRHNIECELFEASEHPGGLLEAIPFYGLHCDRGSHRIHTESVPELFTLCPGIHWENHPRRGVILLNNRRVRYPLNAWTLAQSLGLKTSASMLKTWAMRPERLQKLSTWNRDREVLHSDESFEDFVCSRVGDRAYEMFYRPYAVKLWGLDPSKISHTAANLRVSTTSPLSTLFGRSTSREFLYPRGGMGALFDHFWQSVLRTGVRTQLGASMDPTNLDADHVIYTGHLSDVVPQTSLTHRGLYIVHLALEPNTLDDTDTWYTPEAHFWFGRVSQPARFSPTLATPHGDILAVEIPEGSWGTNHNFLTTLNTLVEQLAHAGIVSRNTQVLAAQQTFIPRVYPLYLRGWITQWQQAMQEAVRLHVIPTGRQGLFLHCNLDQSLHTGIAAATHITKGIHSMQWMSQAMRFHSTRVRD